MNFIRKLLGFFTAVAFLAMAAPATAQNVKYFTLGAPASVAPATTTVQITFKNVENGNSSFNSIGFRGIATGGVATGGGIATCGVTTGGDAELSGVPGLFALLLPVARLIALEILAPSPGLFAAGSASV